MNGTWGGLMVGCGLLLGSVAGVRADDELDYVKDDVSDLKSRVTATETNDWEQNRTLADAEREIARLKATVESLKRILADLWTKQYPDKALPPALVPDAGKPPEPDAAG